MPKIVSMRTPFAPRHRWGAVATSSAALVLLLAPRASAQSAPPYDPAIDLQLFEYAIGPKTFLSVSDADTGAAGHLAVDAMVTYLTKPLTIWNVSDDGEEITSERTNVVESILAGELSASYGINDDLQVGAALPLVFSMTGDGLDPSMASGTMDGLQISGLGDLRAELKYRLVQSGGFRLAAIGGLSVPTSYGSGGNEFIGDDLPTGRLRAAAQWSSGVVSLGTNVGVLLRKPRDIYASTVGQQLLWGVAGAVRFTDRFSLVAEGFGRTGLPEISVDGSPIEVGGGARILATKAIAVVLGGGGGVVRGIGSPELRFFVSLGYAPDSRDSDGDGIPNSSDRCPLVAEDKDGFQDSDGCADDDNDGDRREDAIDKCVSEPEDLDGFEDEDGCPELDNDKDGIADTEDRCVADAEDGVGEFDKDGCPAGKRDSDGDTLMDTTDQCPREAEDEDGFEDWDGCPDPDQDKDGVDDADDQCALCPEDKDGVADGDGCPEIDGDGDGVLDTADKCPTEAESINGVDDFDGCDDGGGAQLARLDGDRIVLDRQPGFDRKGLNRAGEVILDQAALVMLQSRDVTQWVVAVAAKSRSEAARQAGWVRTRLTSRGVPAKSIQVLGSAGDPQVGILARERAEGDAAKAVCPAGEIKARPAPGGGATVPAPAAKPAPTPAKPAPKKPAAPGAIDDLK
jgi:OOP family OmpA-OmpF porin